MSEFTRTKGIVVAINAHEENLGAVLWDQNIYLVPPYQRNFSWEKDQISTLWKDLIRTAYSGDTYFLGSLVFVKTDSAMIFDILDGQQRFASLLLTLAAFRHVIRAANPTSQNLHAIESALIKVDVTGKFNNQNVVHIRLNYQDEDFFKSLIEGGLTPEPAHASHKLILKAFEDLKRLVVSECAERSTTPDLLWETLKNALTQRLFTIRITVDDYVNAQQVFQALNSAGLELSQSDLIKNYVLMEAGKPNFDQVLKLWLGMAESVGDKGLTSYIRAFWNSAYPFVRTNDLYRRLRDAVKLHPDSETGQVDVMLFTRQLRDEAVVYDALRSPDSTYWGAANSGLVQDLGDLRDLGATMLYVPLLALRYALKNDTPRFAMAVKALLAFYVRHTVVGGRAANEVEEDYNLWAREIRTGAMTPDDLVLEVAKISPTDAQFESDLLNYTVSRRKTAGILLARINDSINPANNIRTTITSGGRIHVEHIIPQQPEKWQTFLDSQGIVHEEIVNMFGNLTLLLGPKNQEASNKEFADKIPVYQADGHPEPLNAMLVSIASFGDTELKARQRWLADQAMKIWTL